MLDRIRTEPALVTGAVSAVIALAVAFGLDLTSEQTGAIMAAVVAVMALVTRTQVVPTVKVAAKDTSGGTVAGPAADVPEGDPAEVIPDYGQPGPDVREEWDG